MQGIVRRAWSAHTLQATITQLLCACRPGAWEFAIGLRVGAGASTSPDRCLFCPARIRVPIAELLCRRAECCRIAQRLVARDARPIERLRRRFRVRMIFDDGRELLFGLGKETSTELRVGEAQLQLSEKVVS